MAELMTAMGVDDITEAARAITANKGRKKAVQTLACVAGIEWSKRYLEDEFGGSIEYHHSIPAFGQGLDENLMPLPTSTHRVFHFVLNILIRDSKDFAGMTGYSSAAEWAKVLESTVAKRALLDLIKVASKYIDKQCKLPKSYSLYEYVKDNEKRWLRAK